MSLLELDVVWTWSVCELGVFVNYIFHSVYVYELEVFVNYIYRSVYVYELEVFVNL
jgi:hypothetical protein